MYRENDGSDGQGVVSEEQRQLRELAAAIRRGCRLRPKQCRNHYFAKADSACVIGAAFLGSGDRTEEEMYEDLIVQLAAHGFSILDSEVIDGVSLGSRLIGWNDDGHTREEITDWLEAEAMKR